MRVLEASLAVLHASKLHRLAVLRILMQTLTAHLISQEIRPHRRPRPIERVSVGIHWRVERLA